MKKCYGTILLLAVAVLFVTLPPCGAAENDDQSIWAEGQPERGHKRQELTDEKIKRIMTWLREHNPKEAEKLAELRQADPERFTDQIRKHMSNRMGRRIEPDVEDSSRRKHGGPQPPPRRGRGPAQVESGRRRIAEMRARHAEYLEWLKKNYPEEAEKLAQLTEKDPQLCMRKMLLGLKKYRRIFEASKENPQLAEVLKEDMELDINQRKLLRKIKAAADDEEKEELKTELQKLLSTKYDLIVRRKEIKLEILLTKLQELEKEVRQSRAKLEKCKDPEFKQENVDARLDELLSKIDKFEWD